MVRILQVVADGKPGGGTTVVLTLSSLLAERGHEVHFVSQQGSYALEEARRLGLHAHGIDFSSRWKTPVVAAHLSSLMRRISPRVVHAHGARAGLPVSLACSLTRQGPTRRLYTVHGFHYQGKKSIVRWLARLAETACMRSADATIFVSAGDRELAQRDGLLRWTQQHSTIHNAVLIDPELMQTQTKTYDVGFLGRLTRQKNPLFLTRIFQALQPDCPRIAVIGGGELQQRLQQDLADAGLLDRVSLLGECSRTRALELLAQCRVLVLPSLWEGHPIALIEAAQLAIPAVASDIQGSNEVIDSAVTGFLVSPHEPQAYAQRLRQLLDDDELRATMGRTARALAQQRYSPQAMLACHLREYGLAAAGTA
jgi:glycosyltransferase involved in cell wall biosynthesis